MAFVETGDRLMGAEGGGLNNLEIHNTKTSTVRTLSSIIISLICMKLGSLAEC